MCGGSSFTLMRRRVQVIRVHGDFWSEKLAHGELTSLTVIARTSHEASRD